MVAKAQTGSSRWRLNPFAFPSDTDFRFVLLIISVFGSAIFIYNNMYFFFTDNIDRFYVDLICNQITGDISCLYPDFQLNALWTGLCLLLLLSVAGAIYWLYPVWIIRHKRLIPLPDNKERLAYLENLCREAGLARMPIFLMKLLDGTATGVTFGHFRRYYVCLNQGLVMQFTNDRPAFRATVLHELSHIRNKDIDKTYFTLAITWAFVFVALLPLAIDMLLLLVLNFGLNAQIIFNITWRLLCFCLVIYLTRSAILRARETYADVRASVWDGPGGALQRTILSLPYSQKPWQNLWDLHPDPDLRQLLVNNPAGLLIQSYWDIFVAGLIATSFLTNVSSILADFFASTSAQAYFIETDLLGILFACLVTGIVGLGAWRTIFAQQIQGNVHFHTLRTGFFLTLGLLFGQTLSLTAYQTGNGYFTATNVTNLHPTINWNVAISFLNQLKTLHQFNITSPVFDNTTVINWNLILISLFLDLLLLVVLILLLLWIASTARTWLAVAARNASPRSTYWIGFVMASIIIGICFAEIAKALKLVQGSNLPNEIKLAPSLLSLNYQANPPSVVFNLAQDPLFCLALILLWAYPLAAMFWQNKMVSIANSSWTYLDVALQPRLLTRNAKPALHLAFPVLAGLIGGLIFWGIDFFVLRRGELNASTALLQGNVTIYAVLLQGITAVIVAGWAQYQRTFSALLAAFIAGYVMVLGIELHTGIILHMAVQAGQIGTTFLQIVDEGALVALPLALLVSAPIWRNHSNSLAPTFQEGEGRSDQERC